MKWCTNCKSNELSYAEKGYKGSNHENRCWKCDKYTLNNTSLITEQDKGNFSATIREVNNSGGGGGEIECKVVVGNTHTGDYRSESLVYRPPTKK